MTAVLALGVIAGVLLFTYACTYHLYVVHGNPLALQEVPLLGLSHASAAPQAQAFKVSQPLGLGVPNLYNDLQSWMVSCL